MPESAVKADEKTKSAVIELMKVYNWKFNPAADLVLVQKGLSVPEKGLAILFSPDDLSSLIKFLSEVSAENRGTAVLAGRKHNTFEPVRVEDILFFKADGNYVFCHTGSSVFEIKQKLYEIEKMFFSNNFIRVNKSFIVNILKVKEIIPWFGGRLLLKIPESSERIEVSRNFVKGFKDYLGM